ncbi:MAG: uroporphyrinogen decarboxylase family protein [Christensenella sp.]
MNSKERVFARISGKPVDVIPNLNIIMQLAAREMGVAYSKYCKSYELHVKGNILCAQKYGLDVVTVMSDPMREAHDFGTEVVFPEDDVPYPKQNFLEDIKNIKNLKPISVDCGERMSDSVHTIELYKKELGDEYPVVGWVEGCFAEASDLRGVNNFLLDLYEEPEFVRELLDICLEQAKLYAKAQVAAGADIIGVGDAIASVAGPNVYRELAGEYERKLLTAIQEMGAKTKLHICGNIEPFLEQLPVDVIDILDVDHMVSFDKAMELCGDSVAISGNYDPVAVLLQGTPAVVREAVCDCAHKGNSRYISAAGCEVPKYTPKDNLLAVHEQLKAEAAEA